MNFQLLKAFIPSWRFFADVGHVPVLQYRFETANEFGPWLTYPPKQQRSWLSLVFNPAGNVAHAIQNLFVHLMLDSQSSEKIEATIAYGLVQNLVAAQVPAAQKFQFKLSAKDLVTSESEDILVSPVYGN